MTTQDPGRGLVPRTRTGPDHVVNTSHARASSSTPARPCPSRPWTACRQTTRRWPRVRSRTYPPGHRSSTNSLRDRMSHVATAERARHHHRRHTLVTPRPVQTQPRERRRGRGRERQNGLRCALLQASRGWPTDTQLASKRLLFKALGLGGSQPRCVGLTQAEAYSKDATWACRVPRRRRPRRYPPRLAQPRAARASSTS